MNGEKVESLKDVVTSIGNAWVIGRSKSYQGRPYYFNTLTGKSAWNLCEAEMEKAKKFSQNNTMPINCPEPQEPQEPPGDLIAQQPRNTKPNKVYNKQIINNQLARIQPFGPTFANTSFSCVNSDNQVAGFNPNVWSMPPIQPIIIAPAMGNLQSPLNIISQHASTSNDYYSKFNHRRFSYRGRGRYNFQRRGDQYYNRRKQESPDLRVILTAKRRLQDVCDKKDQDSNTAQSSKYESETEISANVSTNMQSDSETKDNLYPSDIDEEWLEEHTHYDGTKPILDVSALSRLASKNGDSECWYIVVDANVLLNHLDFLNVLLNSDNNCLLIVQQATMTELRQGTVQGDTRLKKRCRRALCSLSQQFHSKNAVIDDQHIDDDSVFGRHHQALSCCILLAQKKQHVILLTDDEDLIEYKREVSFPIFSVCEIKKFLEAKYTDAQIQFPETEELSITIPNDISEDVDIKLSPPDTSCELISTQDEETPLSTNSNSNTTVSKNTVDAEVQTDCDNQVIADTTTMLEVTNDNRVQGNFEDNCSNTNESVSNNSTEKIAKRRSLRLKRSTLQNSNSSTEIKDIQFKWHKKRKPINSCTSSVSDVSSRLQQDANIAEESSTNQSKHNNINNSDMVANSETSSCVVMRQNVDEGVTIDETSTSEISNSVCSESGLPQVYSSYSFNLDDQNKSVMFEITSKFMEEHLRRNIDEWISRFIQIMEEVLSQVLRQPPAFVHPLMPPPWTAHEAVQCIKKKFMNQPDVTDACNKLSQMFFEFSDLKGNIERNMPPEKFMEMYSYGVYLIDTLVSVQDNEDLQTSTESLTKLLSDIQDPNLEAMNNSFIENINDLSLKVQEQPRRPETPVQQSSLNVECSELNIPITPRSTHSTHNAVSKNSTPTTDSTRNRYKLRSATKKDTEERNKVSPEVKFVRTCDLQTSFFSSLNLQERINKSVCNTNKSPENPKPTNEQSPITTNTEKNFSPDKTEPKIIRNFTQCVEYEKRIQTQSKPQLDLDDLDYYENSDDNAEEFGYDDYYEENEYLNRDQQLVTDTEDQFLPRSVSSGSSDDDTFKLFIAAIWCEIKHIISKVHTFCENTIQHLQDRVQLSSLKYIEIQDHAAHAQKELDNICTALRSVNRNNLSDSSDSVQELLRYFGIDSNDDIIMNEEQLGKYREMVSKCTDQAEILQTSLNIIMDAINK